MAYKDVRELVPSLWDGRKIDFAIHMGLAAGREFYSVERRGHRDGYSMKDVDDKLLDDNARREHEKENWIWDGVPAELLTSCDIDDVWKRWRVAMPVCVTPHVAAYRELSGNRKPMSEFPKMQADICAISYTSLVWPISPRRMRKDV